MADDLAGNCPSATVHAPASLLGTGDPLRLDQVLTNLLSNTAKYGEGRPIEVTLTHADSRARLSVRDQGLGIAPQDHLRILTPFERAVSPSSYGGLGLGLWIVQEIVARMDGRIELDSRPGVGATITIEVPWSG